MNSWVIKTATYYCALWTTLKRLESRGTKGTNGLRKCDTTEKNRFDSVLMDDLSVRLHPMGAATVCSVAYSHGKVQRLFLSLKNTQFKVQSQNFGLDFISKEN